MSVPQETLDQYSQAAKAAADSWSVTDPELRARIEERFRRLNVTSAEMLTAKDCGIIETTSLTPEQQVCRHTYTRTGTRCENCGGGIREIEMFRRYRQ